MPEIPTNAERTHAPDQIAAVVHLMEVMLDPLSRKLASAPNEDETIDADEENAVEEARQWRKHNKPVPHEEVLADFGLTMDDFQAMASPLESAKAPVEVIVIDSVHKPTAN